ncbi:MAG: sigma-70 family RNA polymerase sigma factor [Limnochordia bacterium]
MKTDNQALDMQLLSAIRRGDPEAKEKLVTKYIPMVKHIVSSHYASFLDFEDLMQEGLIGLLSAIEEYRPECYEVKFSSFAYICIIRKIYNVIKHSNSNKHKALNSALSLHSFVNNDETRTVFDQVKGSTGPEDLIEQKLINQKLNKVLKNHLSLLEYTVIILLLQGYTSREIEEQIGVNGKVVDNARTRVKLKLRRLLKEYGSLLHPGLPGKVRKREDLYLDLKFSS